MVGSELLDFFFGPAHFDHIDKIIIVFFGLFVVNTLSKISKQLMIVINIMEDIRGVTKKQSDRQPRAVRRGPLSGYRREPPPTPSQHE